jgi:hypothetical protein
MYHGIHSIMLSIASFIYTCSAYESEKVHVEQVLTRLVLINLGKVSSTRGVEEGHPSMVLMSSIRGVVPNLTSVN